MKRYAIREISFPVVRDFMTRHHYAGGMANTTVGAWGLYEGASLIGALSFNTPVSEAARATVFGWQHRARVTELSRLVILDVTPKNTESWFIARALKALRAGKPDLWAVLSYSDPAAGHVGTIYQASGAFYAGMTGAETFYFDADGRLRHKRQCGRTLTTHEARERGWTPVRRPGKHRYMMTLPQDRRHKRWLDQHITLPFVWPYPKLGYTNGLFSEGIERTRNEEALPAL